MNDIRTRDVLVALLLVGCSPSNGDPPPATQASANIGTVTLTAGERATAVVTVTTGAMTAVPTTSESTVARITILPVEPDISTAAATNLSSTTGCNDNDPRLPYAELMWRPAAEQGRAQRVQVSVDPRGFTYPLVGAELPGDATSTAWTEVAGQARHLWRVLTEHDGRWTTSPTAQFDGPTCAIDYQPEP
jgi:hypothetical protein